MTRDEIIALTLEEEDGFVDNPKDPGGATNFGITQHYLNVARTANQSLALPYDVRDLTKEQAVQLYQLDQWTAVHGDQLPWQLALLAFDTAVNEGPARAVECLQRAVGVTVDGKVGPATIAAAAAAPIRRACRNFATHRAVLYARLDVREDGFEEGWMGRNIDVYTKAIL